MNQLVTKCLKFLQQWRIVFLVLFSFFILMICLVWNSQSRSLFLSKYYSNAFETIRTKSYVSPLCNCQREIVLAKDPSGDFQWCGFETWSRGRGQKVISFVLYGVHRVNGRYFSLIKNISSTAEKLYPGWVIRIIYKIFGADEENSGEEILATQLCEAYCQFNNIDLCSMSDLIERVRSITISTTNNSNIVNRVIDPDLLVGLQPKMWRFLALLDPNVDIFISRDLDSLIWRKEVDAVDQWIRSNFTFHSMRDHPQHGVTFMGGMWGVKLDRRRDLMEGLTRAIVRFGQGQNVEGPADQTILNEIIWPIAQYDVMVHDSYHCQNEGLKAKTLPPKVFPFPTKRDGRLFVGGIGQNPTVEAKCPEACRPTDGKD